MPSPEELADTIAKLIDSTKVGASAQREFMARDQGLPAPPTEVKRARAPTSTSPKTPSPKAPGKPRTPAINVGGTTNPPAGTSGSLAPAGGGTTPRAAGGGVTPAPATTSPAPSNEVRGVSTGYTDAEAREITRTLVGREMGLNELEGWVAAFKREHGATPWQTGPFDETNNFVDHLLALGESEREVAMGGASPFTKAGREGNPMAQPAITPDFWANAYYNRYTGPTYITGPSGPIWMGSRSLIPGELPPTNAPSELGYYGAMQPRPYYEYMPAMNPAEWPSQAQPGPARAPATPLWPMPTGGPSQYWR